MFGQLFGSLCVDFHRPGLATPLQYSYQCKGGDLLLGRLSHAGAILRATEDTTQIVEGAEASTLVCQHLLGQGFPQALCVYAIDARELIPRLHPLRSELRRQGLLVVLAQFASKARFCREVFLLQRV